MPSPDVTSEASSLVATAVAQGFALFATVYIAADPSGGHVNPASPSASRSPATSEFRPPSSCTGSLSWWAPPSPVSCYVSPAGQAITATGIAAEMTAFAGAIVESVATFALVYTVHVASDQRGSRTKGGSLTGGSVNPARSFGPAIISGDIKDQGVNAVGPLIGAAPAVLFHRNLVYLSLFRF